MPVRGESVDVDGDVTPAWGRRFDDLVAELEAHPRVRVLRAHRRNGISPSLARELFARHALVPDEATLAFYAEMNGVCLAWVACDDPGLDPTRHVHVAGPLERMVDMEALFRPVAGAARDYATLNQLPVQRIGFDFPGTYYTPAFAMDGGVLRVQVGNESGLFGDHHPLVPFADYLEGVFGTRGSVDWRIKLFGWSPVAEEATRNPRAYLAAHPVTIESLLQRTAEEIAKAAALSDEPRLAKLVERIRGASTHTFEAQTDGRTLVRVVLPDGSKTMSFLTRDELAKVQRALL